MAALGFIELLRLARRGNKAYSTSETELDRWSGVAFELMGQQFIAPLGEVSEVINVNHFTPIPHTQTWVKGLTNVRGRLLAVSDLHHFLLGEAINYSSKQKILCVNHSNHYFGVVVDHVQGIQHLNKANFYAKNERLDARFEDYCQGCFYQNNQLWNVFLLSRLLKNPQYMNASVNLRN